MSHRDTGEASSEYSEHFLCNTYKTLAIQHPQKEEQVLAFEFFLKQTS